MKALLLNLTVAALFVMPVFGQTAEHTAPAPAGEQISNATVAEPPVQAFPVEKAEEPASSYAIFRAAGGLGLVIFLMIAGYFAAKKLAPRYFSKGMAERNLKIIETLSMGDKRSISMIEMGNSRFLVGNTAQQISLLMTLPEHVSILSEPEALPEPSKGASKKDFPIPFKSLFEVEKKRPVQPAAHPLPDDVRVKMRQLREALER
jgi:flagellar biogenesis protein FliO